MLTLRPAGRGRHARLSPRDWASRTTRGARGLNSRLMKDMGTGILALAQKQVRYACQTLARLCMPMVLRSSSSTVCEGGLFREVAIWTCLVSGPFAVRQSKSEEAAGSQNRRASQSQRSGGGLANPWDPVSAHDTGFCRCSERPSPCDSLSLAAE